ncbi:MAG TPA: M50 family metallopeptidase [Chthoniobacterales bacterium]|nr:M50 family metallopeptidase [Chthoniobacterales bacterium]
MKGGAIRLFSVAGIAVYLHFTWFVIAAFEVTSVAKRYSNPIWGVFEYLALFAIVLLHEFGHAFACRSTGGEVDRIVLWPLGGLAFVRPPPRATAQLWSIAAGPLVNVVLFPVLFAALVVLARLRIGLHNDALQFSASLFTINGVMLIFNLLPLYPLDGGQILRSLLWFRLGPIRSLEIASCVGMVGAIGLGIYALYRSSIWFGMLSFFLLSQAAAGWQHAKAMRVNEDVARKPSADDPRLHASSTEL